MKLTRNETHLIYSIYLCVALHDIDFAAFPSCYFVVYKDSSHHLMFSVHEVRSCMRFLLGFKHIMTGDSEPSLHCLILRPINSKIGFVVVVHG